MFKKYIKITTLIFCLFVGITKIQAASAEKYSSNRANSDEALVIEAIKQMQEQGLSIDDILNYLKKVEPSSRKKNRRKTYLILGTAVVGIVAIAITYFLIKKLIQLRDESAQLRSDAAINTSTITAQIEENTRLEKQITTLTQEKDESISKKEAQTSFLDKIRRDSGIIFILNKAKIGDFKTLFANTEVLPWNVIPALLKANPELITRHPELNGDLE